MAISYEKFMGVLQSDLVSYMGDGYETYEVRFSKVKKINRVLDGFSVFNLEEEKEKCVIAPTMYAQDMYEEYLLCDDLDEVLTKASNTIKHGIEVARTSVAPFTDLYASRDKIVFEIINKQRNSALLCELPHKEFLDLAIVYRVVAGFDTRGITSALVNYSMLDMLEVSEEELFDLAFENTKQLLPFKVKGMAEIVINMMKRDGVYTEDVLEKLERIPEHKRLYVVTNDYTFCAASALMYPELFDDIANELDHDIYIIPVSINELMVMIASPENEVSDILSMIKHSNSLDESLGEILSDNVYYYDRNERSISIPYELH